MPEIIWGIGKNVTQLIIKYLLYLITDEKCWKFCTDAIKKFSDFQDLNSLDLF